MCFQKGNYGNGNRKLKVNAAIVGFRRLSLCRISILGDLFGEEGERSKEILLGIAGLMKTYRTSMLNTSDLTKKGGVSISSFIPPRRHNS